MRQSIRKSLLAIAAGILLSASATHAAVIQVAEAGFVAGSGLITFGEVGFPVGTVNPIYMPADYGGVAGDPIVSFDGFFAGQMLSATPGVERAIHLAPVLSICSSEHFLEIARFRT